MIKEIINAEGLDAIRKEWTLLFQENPNNSPFMSWEWMAAWYKNIGNDASSRIILVYNQDMLCGIAPLSYSTQYRGFRFPRIHFLSEGRTDYLQFLVKPGQEDVFFSELCGYLTKIPDHWDMLDFRDIPQTDSSLNTLKRELSFQFPFYLAETTQVCLTIPLKTDWEGFIQSLGKRTRKDVKYDRRFLQNQFNVQFEVYKDITNSEKGFRDLVRVFQRRRQKEQGLTRYNQNRTFLFERDMCQALTMLGNYRIFLLYLDGKPVAGFSGLVHSQKLYGDTFVHDPDYSKYSIGNVLLGYCIEWCIHEGLNELDLSRGKESYKYKWNGIEKRNMHVKVFKSRKDLCRSQWIDHFYERLVHIKAVDRLYHFSNRIVNTIKRIILIVKKSEPCSQVLKIQADQSELMMN